MLWWNNYIKRSRGCNVQETMERFPFVSAWLLFKKIDPPFDIVQLLLHYRLITSTLKGFCKNKWHGTWYVSQWVPSVEHVRVVGRSWPTRSLGPSGGSSVSSLPDLIKPLVVWGLEKLRATHTQCEWVHRSLHGFKPGQGYDDESGKLLQHIMNWVSPFYCSNDIWRQGLNSQICKSFNILY